MYALIENLVTSFPLGGAIERRARLESARFNMPAEPDAELMEQLTEYIDRHQWPFHEELFDLIRNASFGQRSCALQTQARNGYTALHRAILRRHYDFVDLILGSTYDHLSLLIIQNQHGQTPLHAAVNSKSPEMVYILLNSLNSAEQQLALLEVKDNQNWTAFDLATQSGRPAIVQAINSYRLREPADALVKVEPTRRPGTAGTRHGKLGEKVRIYLASLCEIALPPPTLPQTTRVEFPNTSERELTTRCEVETQQHEHQTSMEHPQHSPEMKPQKKKEPFPKKTVAVQEGKSFGDKVQSATEQPAQGEGVNTAPLTEGETIHALPPTTLPQTTRMEFPSPSEREPSTRCDVETQQHEHQTFMEHPQRSPEMKPQKKKEPFLKKNIAVQEGKSYGEKVQLAKEQPAQGEDVNTALLTEAELLRMDPAASFDAGVDLVNAEFQFDSRESTKYIFNPETKISDEAKRKLEQRLALYQANKIGEMEEQLRQQAYTIADLIRYANEQNQHLISLQARLEIVERRQQSSSAAISNQQ